eukprot:gnl/TRDRNA2_/TRDRNA2_82501_c0_seq1.p1 gnl/TRDRNA2_/TRDRNA2_82501_c0~~gnl/TRDRNA2_/TRDRNA2_82501_c0_seq1.p1  ORF type:complete len:214 (+),score=43.89 gnl/TRDRNA2_/TRDRNA2_82501_c0_seq1:3-644(+)
MESSAIAASSLKSKEGLPSGAAGWDAAGAAWEKAEAEAFAAYVEQQKLLMTPEAIATTFAKHMGHQEDLREKALGEANNVACRLSMMSSVLADLDLNTRVCRAPADEISIAGSNRTANTSQRCGRAIGRPILPELLAICGRQHGDRGPGDVNGISAREEIADLLVSSLRSLSCDGVAIKELATEGAGSNLVCDFTRLCFAAICLQEGIMMRKD